MARQRAILRPTRPSGAKILKIRLRITTTNVPADAGVEITDLMLQPGSVVTGWRPHVTEQQWVVGIVGGP